MILNIVKLLNHLINSIPDSNVFCDEFYFCPLGEQSSWSFLAVSKLIDLHMEWVFSSELSHAFESDEHLKQLHPKWPLRALRIDSLDSRSHHDQKARKRRRKIYALKVSKLILLKKKKIQIVTS